MDEKEEEENKFHNTFVKRSNLENNNNSQLIKAGIAATITILENVKERKERAPDKRRHIEKQWWSEVYGNYSDDNFKSE